MPIALEMPTAPSFERPAPTLAIHLRLEIKNVYRFLWLKRVTGFKPEMHCARCLIGGYAKIVPYGRTEPGTVIDTDVDWEGAPYLYLCGVAGRYAGNLHIAMEPDPVGEIEYEDDYCRVRIVGARRLPIDSLPEADRAGLTAPFYKCRNFQFGWQYLRGEDERESVKNQCVSL